MVTEISIVIPFFNEQENARVLVEEIMQSQGESQDYEIVCVDDASTDKTLEILKECQRNSSVVRVIHHVKRSGQSTAICTGIRHAHSEWIVTMDGDGQNDPADIRKFLEYLDRHEGDENLGMLIGWRKNRRDTWLRRISSKIANGVRSRLLRDATPDTGCGLKLIRRSYFLRLPYFDHMHRFLPALMQRAGYTVHSIEVNHRQRTRGKSKYGVHNRLWVGIVDLFGVMWLLRRARLTQVEEIFK